MPSVLFVCSANICRSPLAEAVFRDLVAAAGLTGSIAADSAGVRAREGAPPDPRTVEVGARHGVDLSGRSRPVDPPTDADRFDLFIAMDRDHEAWLVGAGIDPARVRLLRAFDPEAVEAGDLEVPDPYSGGPEGFERMYRMIERSCRRLLASLSGG